MDRTDSYIDKDCIQYVTLKKIVSKYYLIMSIWPAGPHQRKQLSCRDIWALGILNI